MKDKLIIFSGGLDSTTMLYEYANEIALAVTFDYGSNHAKKEIECAKYHCNLLNIEQIIIPLDFIHQYFKSSLLSGADEIPEGHYEAENMKSTVVPFRNGIMLSIAAGIAESRGLKYIMIANHAGDHAIYPDCRQTFISSISDAIAYGTYDHIRIYAPYTSLTKSDIVKRGSNLETLDYSKTWSCYKGQDIHCGKCGTCVERKEAFELANVKDPTIYEK